ncbi:MAG: hypothetical protein JWN18_683 [Parcubacteria group bacterium]|nr:hypothetical protein [Parcubacteria group bacterium]
MSSATNAGRFNPVDIQIEKPRDSVTSRDWAFRWMVNMVISALVICVPLFALLYVGGRLDHPLIGGTIGYVVGIWVLSLLLPRMIVSNPEYTGYVTLNSFKPGDAEMVTYGPGFHMALPWEERNANGTYSLRVITREFTLTTPTKSSAITIEGRLFYNASLKFLENAVGVDKEVVEEGNIAFIDSYLITKLSEIDAEEAASKIKQIGIDLNKDFRDTPAITGVGTATPEEFEKKFGYSTAAIAIDKVILAPKVQEAIDAISEARKMNEIATGLLGISQADLAEMLKNKIITVKQVKEMLDRALVTSGNATMQLNVVEGEMAAAVASFLGQGGKGGKS